MPDKELSAVYSIGNFIDTFALGHYARVLDAADRRNDRQVALKVMRPEHLDRSGQPQWEAQAFIHEADLLTRLQSHAVPMKFYDCGYLSTGEEYPASGQIRSFQTDIAAFREGLYPNIAAGWRPYLALEYLPRHNNLLYVMQPGQGGQRRRLPTEEGLDLAMQFGELLRFAHAAGIVYMDHKLEHIYWDGEQLRIIDWNSSKFFPQRGQNLEQHCQKDIHNLCVGVLYPIFTGLSPQRGGLRPQPAGQNEVDARYSDISHLDFSVEPTLSSTIIDLLEKGARQDIATADVFLRALQDAAVNFGWQPLEQTADATLRKARVHMRQGLAKLRKGEEYIREARELFLEAATFEGIPEELEDELRRLLKGTHEFLNARTIP